MKILCLFGCHKYRRIVDIKKLAWDIELIGCVRCRKLFIMHHGIKAILPYDKDFKHLYDYDGELK